MGRPFNGSYPQAKSASSTITPIQAAAQQAAMIALGAGSYMPPGTGTGIPMPPPVPYSITPTPPPPIGLTPSQQAAKDKAQALLNKLGQSVGLIPTAQASTSSATVRPIKSINVK